MLLYLLSDWCISSSSISCRIGWMGSVLSNFGWVLSSSSWLFFVELYLVSEGCILYLMSCLGPFDLLSDWVRSIFFLIGSIRSFPDWVHSIFFLIGPIRSRFHPMGRSRGHHAFPMQVLWLLSQCVSAIGEYSFQEDMLCLKASITELLCSEHFDSIGSYPPPAPEPES